MEFSQVKEQSRLLYDKFFEVHKELLLLWKNNMLFTWRWWVTFALVAVPWLIWFFAHKKNSRDRLLYAAFFVMIASSFLDMMGTKFGLWYYPIKLLPLIPDYIGFDLSTLPVVTMLGIQYLPKVRPIYKAIVYALVASYIFQPLTRWLGLYMQIHWEDYYSVPILILIYLAADYIAKRNRFAPLKE